MLLGSSLTNAPIMGIQTGSEIARTIGPIVDPATLGILAYEVSGHNLDMSAPNLLRIADVREFSDIGFIVDSIDEFIHPDDVIKLRDFYDQHFDPTGMNVIDETRHKLGKVVDFTIETSGFIIQQLSIRPPLLRSFNTTELLIHRSQIIEINNNAIVVHSQAKAPEPKLNEVVGSYVNPFRKPKSASESSQEK